MDKAPEEEKEKGELKIQPGEFHYALAKSS